MTNPESQSAYQAAGVDIEAGSRAVRLMKAAVEATHGPRVLGGLGSFGGMYDVSFLKAYDAPVLVSSTDGVGTKTKIAAAVGRYGTIGACLVNHCINDILVQGAEPLFFLDYVAASKLDSAMIADVVSGCASACKGSGLALVGGETAEMPGVYVEGELDLAGTIVGVVERDKLIHGRRIEPGDVVIAVPSSGLHTNGYSLARRALAGLDLLEAREELGGASLADALLAIHKPYLNEFRALREAAVDIRGMVHVTGGGLIDNPPRVLTAHTAFRFYDDTIVLPPIFAMIQRLGNVPRAEMLHVFNCGVGMLFVVPEMHSAAALAALEGGWVVGEIVERGAAGPVEFV